MRLAHDSKFNNHANLIVLCFKRFLFSAAEAGFATPRFPARLTKTFSLAQARAFRTMKQP
jgi:hypothetical protein